MRAAVLLLAFIAACRAASPEQQQLIEFFQASRLNDLTVVANMATVTFNPRTDGSVQHFDVEQVSEDGGVKEVTILAQVRKPDGHITAERMAVTMQRGATGRWIITRLRALRTSPAASSARPS